MICLTFEHYNTRQRVLNKLKLVYVGFGCSMEQRIAIIKSGADDNGCNLPGCLSVNTLTNVSQCSNMVTRSLTDIAYVLVEG